MLAARGVPVAEFNLEDTPVTGQLKLVHLFFVTIEQVDVRFNLNMESELHVHVHGHRFECGLSTIYVVSVW